MKKIYSLEHFDNEDGSFDAFTTDSEHYVLRFQYNAILIMAYDEKHDEKEVAARELPCTTTKLAELGCCAFSVFMTSFLYKVLREEGFMIKKEYLNQDIPSFFWRICDNIIETNGDDPEFV